MVGATRIVADGAVIALGAVLAVHAGGGGPTDVSAAEDAGDTLVVATDGSGAFRTIGEAIDAAADGDTILVRPGTYAEAVVIDKDISLTGDGSREEIVIAFSDGVTPVASIVDSEATVSNLTLTGEDPLVHVVGGAPTLQGILFDHVGGVVDTDGGCHALFGPTGCNPISLRLDGTRALVSGNTFRDSGEIRVHGGAAPVIEGTRCRVGRTSSSRRSGTTRS